MKKNPEQKKTKDWIECAFESEYKPYTHAQTKSKKEYNLRIKKKLYN